MSILQLQVQASWMVAEGGYKVDGGKVVEALKPPLAEHSRIAYRPYSPDEFPGMSMDFTWSCFDEAGVLRFASRYGNLWRDERTLKEWVEWRHHVSELSADPDGLPYWPWGDNVDVHRTTQQLEGLTILVTPVPVLCVRPKDLASFLCMQASMHLLARAKFDRCYQCGWHAPVSPKRRPGAPVFCSDKCRYEAFRERKSKAIELVTSGRSIDDAAKQVGSTAETVAGWVRQAAAANDAAAVLRTKIKPPAKATQPKKTAANKASTPKKARKKKP
ncbi:MAG: hypothetical protein U0836_27015 [Pirellulales bacterium]